ncbi:MAG: YcaO-like family protein [Thermodesulfobacteriota bacterium]
MINQEIGYILKKETTRQQTGFFVVAPDDRGMTLEAALKLLEERPLDSYLHQHVITALTGTAPDRAGQLLNPPDAGENIIRRALEAEYLLLTRGRDHLLQHVSADTIRDLSRLTPLIYLRSVLEPDQPLHCQWTAFFRENIRRHQPLSPPDQTGLPPLAFGKRSSAPTVTVAALAASLPKPGGPSSNPVPPGITADLAAERLDRSGVSLGPLMRHEASLSPIGLLRTWRMAIRVDNGRNRYTLGGEQTAFGRGLSLDAARASLMMEIVERCSAFASVSAHGLENYRNGYTLRRASYSELIREGTDQDGAGTADVLDPASLALEAAYRDQPLHWVRGETPVPDREGVGTRPIWIPAQCLFLFCNLDEPDLFSGLGSTGLAAGNTPAQAKVAGLMEITERHQAATVPFDPATCFRLLARDPQVTDLLEAYRRAGIDLWFQDITPPCGIPCCRCFAVEKSGEIHTGAAAHLDARRAILSAITENTCPFPEAPATRPAPADLTLVGYENLPDYSTGDPAADLALVETLLLKNNYRPCYVDLTRSDIDLPVVRAIIPGMELLGDFDAYSRIHPDLYRNYLALF